MRVAQRFLHAVAAYDIIKFINFSVSYVMPLDKARESKRSRVTDKGPSASAESDEMSRRLDADTREVDLTQFVTMSEDMLDTDNEAVDPSFNLDSSLRSEEALCGGRRDP